MTMRILFGVLSAFVFVVSQSNAGDQGAILCKTYSYYMSKVANLESQLKKLTNPLKIHAIEGQIRQVKKEKRSESCRLLQLSF